jgi:imidazolonepropionase-like amidohydrolase
VHSSRAAWIAACWLVAQLAAAQNLVIRDARIVDGTGSTLERGTIVVRDGRIATISAGATDTEGLPEIDAAGMTAIPGLIDTHRHDLIVDLAAPRSEADLAAALESEIPGNLRTLLDEGFTTIMVPAFDLATALEVRRRQQTGALAGPRLLITGPAITGPGDHPAGGVVCRGNPFCGDYLAIQLDDPAAGRTAVRRLAAAGVDAIKVIVDKQNVPDIFLSEAVVVAVIDEAHSLDLPAFLHVDNVVDMVALARLGADRFVHTPFVGRIANGNGATLLRDRGIAVATTVSFTSPQWSKAIDAEFVPQPHALVLDNVRHLWDEGVVVAFGTDSPPLLRPLVEIEQLASRLSPEEVVAALTRNAAAYLKREAEIGTLEPGKLADIVLISGDPLADAMNLAQIALVVQGGTVVADRRR